MLREKGLRSVFAVGADSRRGLGGRGIGRRDSCRLEFVLVDKADHMVVAGLTGGRLGRDCREYRLRLVEFGVGLDYIDTGFVGAELERFGLVGDYRVGWGCRME